MTTIGVIDVETDRFDGEEGAASVIELAVVKVLFDAIIGDSIDAESWLFRPADGAKITPRAMAVHHITDERVAEFAPFVADYWPHAIDGCDLLAAHNAAFDRTIIERIVPSGRRWVCTLKCARVAFPEAPAYGNQVLRYWLDLPVTLSANLHPHRAAYDAIVTGALLVRLIEHFDGDLERMIQISSEPSLLSKIGFGKHRGTRWADAPRDYLRWVLSTDFGPDERHTAAYHLNGGRG